MNEHLKKINALIDGFDAETNSALQAISKTKKYKLIGKISFRTKIQLKE